ncbi:helix-turn-helix domain-containing protein [Paenibacillus taichungensis]|uniref:helix-turn-helix domain-containing protein n=1 Tax=Paenibacillus taichungensis TaxID=484184 RepID=UPI0038D22A00
MLEREKTLDPESVGRKIREIRKKKEYTLIDLANKLGYATGKLSNIEKGKRAKFPFEELVDIANALNEPVELFIIDESDQFITEQENIRQQISLVKHRLSTGLLSGLKDSLDELQDNIEKLSLKNMIIHINFLWGEYYRELFDYDMALEYYNEVIKAEVYDKETVEAKIRTYNALASLQLQERHIKDAITTLKKALNFIEKEDRVLSLDISNVHYNLTLIYIHIGYMDLAEYHIQTCIETIEGKSEQAYYHALYLLAITYWMKEEYENARNLLFRSMNWFQRQRDLASLFNSLEFIFVMYRVKPHLIIEDMFEYLREFTTVKVPENIVSQKVRCLFMLIEFEIEKKEYLIAQSILAVCKDYIKEYSFAEGYRAFVLEALLIREVSNNSMEERVALEKALSFFEESDRSPQKANILFQLGKLNGPDSRDIYEEALSIFNDNLHEQAYFSQTDFSILPNLRY